jgi:hypothetical protein
LPRITQIRATPGFARLLRAAGGLGSFVAKDPKTRDLIVNGSDYLAGALEDGVGLGFLDVPKKPRRRKGGA